jgi:enterochelin esterase-like enzyme
MRLQTCCIAAALLLCGVVSAQQTVPGTRPTSPDDQYVPGPDSLPQPDVPKGKVFEFTLDGSHIYPGTSRKITVYVPAEYRADKPACVYVGLDALAFEAPVVFDNLIYKHEMPVTIAIGVSPGVVDSASPPKNPRLNRSFEFDALNRNLARFILEEVFPEVERHKPRTACRFCCRRIPMTTRLGAAPRGG